MLRSDAGSAVDLSATALGTRTVCAIKFEPERCVPKWLLALLACSAVAIVVTAGGVIVRLIRPAGVAGVVCVTFVRGWFCNSVRSALALGA